MHDTLGVTRNGDMAWPGSFACTVVLAVDPSPHIILDVDGVGLVSPFMVGFIFLPAPVSIMISPSALICFPSISEIRALSAFLAGTVWCAPVCRLYREIGHGTPDRCCWLFRVLLGQAFVVIDRGGWDRG